MSMLKKPVNKMAYAKVGLYGEAGSGKTYTAAKLAIGLHKAAGCAKPIGMFDTEPAASFIMPLFEEAGIDFLVYDESRALADLMKFMDEAERECSIVIIDSITHVWRDAQESYLKKLNSQRQGRNQRPVYSLEFHHWRPIKAAWADFTDRFLSSKLHCIVCGRAGSIYEYQDKNDGSGKKELITIGTRMATEKELGYEPSLLIEMVKHREDGRIINRALVEKDRSARLNGAEIDKPDYPEFAPHFAALNIGGEHFGSMNARNSADMYEGDLEPGWDQEKRNREIWCEEIKGILIEHGLDGTSNDAKQGRVKVLKEIFGTASWTAVEGMRADDIKAGCHRMRAHLEAAKKQPADDQQSDAA